MTFEIFEAGSERYYASPMENLSPNVTSLQEHPVDWTILQIHSQGAVPLHRSDLTPPSRSHGEPLARESSTSAADMSTSTRSCLLPVEPAELGTAKAALDWPCWRLTGLVHCLIAERCGIILDT